MGFSKLWAEIVLSTIWGEPDHVRLVFVTMLAICDREGKVMASVPGLAHTARVGLNDCKDALSRLQQPDHHSRTPDNEGRRIERIEGGWRLLNYLKYREKGRGEDRREYFRQAKRKQRALKGEDAILGGCVSGNLSTPRPYD